MLYLGLEQPVLPGREVADGQSLRQTGNFGSKVLSLFQKGDGTVITGLSKLDHPRQEQGLRIAGGAGQEPGGHPLGLVPPPGLDERLQDIQARAPLELGFLGLVGLLESLRAAVNRDRRSPKAEGQNETKSHRILREEWSSSPRSFRKEPTVQKGMLLPVDAHGYFIATRGHSFNKRKGTRAVAAVRVD